MLLRIAILATSIATSPAYAEYFNGNKLYDICQGSAGHTPLYTYIAAVIDSSEGEQQKLLGHIAGLKQFEKPSEGREATIANLQLLAKADFCIPRNVSLSQTRDIVCKYLGNNPANRHEGGVWLVTSALGDAFPCQWKKDDDEFMRKLNLSPPKTRQ